jgi:hypothetical protein
MEHARVFLAKYGKVGAAELAHDVFVRSAASCARADKRNSEVYIGVLEGLLELFAEFSDISTPAPFPAAPHVVVFPQQRFLRHCKRATSSLPESADFARVREEAAIFSSATRGLAYHEVAHALRKSHFSGRVKSFLPRSAGSGSGSGSDSTKSKSTSRRRTAAVMRKSLRPKKSSKRSSRRARPLPAARSCPFYDAGASEEEQDGYEEAQEQTVFRMH